jgi:flavin reductase (DIM6/NTAB) family NADH-FMN oxidoreductase RutF
VGLDEPLKAALSRTPHPELRFIDRESKRTLGALKIRHVEDWNAAGTELALFEIAGGRHYCAGLLRRSWDSFRYWYGARHTPPEKQLMPPKAVEQLMVFSLCPRPVFLVSVDDGQKSNLFPMDLVGTLPGERFTLALRNTSASVETIKSARKVAFADVPADACQIAYQLGAHHKSGKVDWAGLPFKIQRSHSFALPVPAIALSVREIEILDFKRVGSHTLFVGRIVSRQPLASGPQLFHTSGIHQRLRRREGRPFIESMTPARR